MKKHSPTNFKPEVRIREMPPRVQEVGKRAQVMCPFCEIPHPLELGQDSACGTVLKISAVQTVYPIRTVNKHKMTCVKCKKGGGEMIKYNHGYVHLLECAPHTKLMASAPEFSRLARAVYFMTPPVRKVLEKRYGLAKQVVEVDEHGQDTGNVLGYFFYKGLT
jgi:hypothetical protein